MSPNSRRQEVSESTVRSILLANELTLLEYDLVLPQIDIYPESVETSGGELVDKEDTVSEASHYVFTTVNCVLVSGDHGLGGSTSRGTSNFFLSKIFEKAMERAFVEAEINIDNFHCILPKLDLTANNPPPGHIAVYTQCLSLLSDDSFTSLREGILSPSQHISCSVSPQLLGCFFGDVDSMT